jgi:hypothetical protein
MADRDILFAVRNNFYIGAYNNAINEASDMEGLSEAEQTERDVYVYRSYIALGSHDVSCATPTSLAWSKLRQASAVAPMMDPCSSSSSHLMEGQQQNMHTSAAHTADAQWAHSHNTSRHIGQVLAAQQ